MNHDFSKNGNDLTMQPTPFLTNSTDDDLTPALDVGISAVMTTILINLFLFLTLMFLYEILRRKNPSVYEGRSHHVRPHRSLPELPSGTCNPFAWVYHIVKIPWWKVRDCAGLDAYMFLRFIHICQRITLASGFWGLLILWPVFGSGTEDAPGWYKFSMANLSQSDKRIWVPTIFMWLFSCYVYYIMNKEFHHYIDLRMEFLGKGDIDIDVQHHYSLMIEQIPRELRSDKALKDYFSSLFPNRVHSAIVALTLPELDKLSTKRESVTRRLEKSIAHFYATRKRPTHVVGRSRFVCCGIESNPFGCCARGGVYEGNYDDPNAEPPVKGQRVDSIQYYTVELLDMNADIIELQKNKTTIAETGNQNAKNWFERVLDSAANFIGMEEGNGDDTGKQLDETISSFNEKSNSSESDTLVDPLLQKTKTIPEASKNRREDLARQTTVKFPGENPSSSSSRAGTIMYNILETIGYDFLRDSCIKLNQNIDHYMDHIVGYEMSSTGFVTFNSLVSVTYANRVLLTHKPNALFLTAAPEPRDIIWMNLHIEINLQKGKEKIANFFVFLGAVLWSIPLTLIQALATAESLSEAPGMGWILTYKGGMLTNFINGYLPVIALLCLILILPKIFNWIAVNYENRKTKSDVQDSILSRYFYYQLANIYVTVTAGSVWDSLADIIDDPSKIASTLGQSLPTVVGYFISLIVVKTLAGLPMVLLRIGELLRFASLRLIYKEKNLTQRELNTIYRSQEFKYGYEYPTQLLVIVICFTYAVISPVVLPFGCVYFTAALLVYKKQILYVYTPEYESGGIMFPSACRYALYGLAISQVTLLGYAILREGYYQPIILFPLPFVTLQVARYNSKHFVYPSKTLCLERATELDKRIIVETDDFSADAYRQPVLTEPAMEPLPYRTGEVDLIQEEICRMVQNADNLYQNESHTSDEDA